MNIPENKYLGKLCIRGHEWKDTGKSIRYKIRNRCVKCIQLIHYVSTPERRKQKRETNQKYVKRPEIIIKIRERAKKYNQRKDVREKVQKLLKTKEYKERVSNYAKKPEYRKRSKINQKNRRDILCDAYIRQLLTTDLFRKEDVTPKLIEAKRFQMKIKRSIRESVRVIV